MNQQRENQRIKNQRMENDAERPSAHSLIRPFLTLNSQLLTCKETQ